VPSHRREFLPARSADPAHGGIAEWFASASVDLLDSDVDQAPERRKSGAFAETLRCCHDYLTSTFGGSAQSV
jgi:hypothetical protein